MGVLSGEFWGFGDLGRFKDVNKDESLTFGALLEEDEAAMAADE